MISSVLLVGFSYSLLLFFNQLKKAIQNHKAHLFIIFLCFISSLEIVYGWLYYTETIYTYAHLLRINTPLTLAIGPAIYFSLQEVLSGEKVKSKVFWLHLLPVLICIFYFIPLYFSGMETKLEYLSELYLGTGFDSILWGGIRRAQQGIYILFISAMLIRKSREGTLNAGALMKSRPLIAMFSSLFVMLWITSLYRYFFEFNFLLGVADVLVVATSLSGILIYGLVTGQVNSQGFSNKRLSESTPTSPGKVKKRIQELFEREKVYLDPNLTIALLAHKSGFSSRMVSECINRLFKINFNGLVNTYRVQHAKKLLTDPGNSHKTIEALAKEAGFGSISAFNDNFKKFTGVTPSRYIDNFCGSMSA